MEYLKSRFFLSRCLFICLLGWANLHADTIDHYMNIANNIPQMEMKADADSQAWARSARTVLTLACDGIADTLVLANEQAKQQGHALFCLDASTQLNADMLHLLIKETYQSLSLAQSEKDKMTVSQIALVGLQKKYPCEKEKG